MQQDLFPLLLDWRGKGISDSDSQGRGREDTAASRKERRRGGQEAPGRKAAWTRGVVTLGGPAGPGAPGALRRKGGEAPCSQQLPTSGGAPQALRPSPGKTPIPGSRGRGRPEPRPALEELLCVREWTTEC